MGITLQKDTAGLQQHFTRHRLRRKFQKHEAGMLTNFCFSQTLRVNMKYLAYVEHDAKRLSIDSCADGPDVDTERTALVCATHVRTKRERRNI